MRIYNTEVCKLQCEKLLCLSGVYNKGEVSGREENFKKDMVFGAHTSQGSAPAVENEIPTWGILTTQKPVRKGGGTHGEEEVLGHQRQCTAALEKPTGCS